jgi:hypothetical protein
MSKLRTLEDSLEEDRSLEQATAVAIELLKLKPKQKLCRIPLKPL